MTEDEQREYKRQRKAADRAKARQAAAEGNVEPSTAAIRDALADAIMLLAVDGPGSAQITTALGRAFPHRLGLTMTVPARARTGKLGPRRMPA